MKKILSLLIALVLAGAAFAQNQANGPVTKKVGGANANDINEDLNVNTARTVNVKGGTLTRTGTGVVSLNATLAAVSVTNGAALDALAAVSSNGLLQRTGANTYSAATIGANLSWSAGTLDTVQGIQTSSSPTFAGLTLTGSAVQFVLGGNGQFYLGDTTGGYLSGGGGAINLTAAGTNQNITFTPSGTGIVSLASQIARQQNNTDGSTQISSWNTGAGTSVVSGFGTWNGTVGLNISTYGSSHATRANQTWLYTNAAQPLIFGVNNTEAFRISSTNVPTFSQQTLVTNTTASSSTSTGALVVGNGASGGLGVGGAIWGGSTANFAGLVTAQGGITTAAVANGAAIISATGSGYASFQNILSQQNAANGDALAIGQSGAAYAGALASVGNSQSYIYSPGRLTIARGAGATNAYHFDSTALIITPTADATGAASTGSVQTAGGILASKNIVSGTGFFRYKSAYGSTASPVTDQIVGWTNTNGGNQGAGLYALNSLTDNSAVWLSFKTYTTGGVATTALTLDSSQTATFTAAILSTSATAGIGYATGAGGTVTQATSRTTGVTLNKVTGDITLVSAAGTTSWQSFTVTNSAVAATDNVKVDQKSGTDKYQIHVTAVAAGSFVITYATTSGTTTEQPVFHFSVIKSVNS